MREQGAEDAAAVGEEEKQEKVDVWKPKKGFRGGRRGGGGGAGLSSAAKRHRERSTTLNLAIWWLGKSSKVQS